MGAERRCWKCKQIVSMDGMKYDLTGKDLVCAQCFAEERTGKKKEEVKEEPTPITEIIPVMAEDVKSSSDNEEVKKTSYQCGSCGFGFSKERQEPVGSCPYCGKNTVRIAFRDSMQKIMEEAEKEKFED